jgi:hypothetical protein
VYVSLRWTATFARIVVMIYPRPPPSAWGVCVFVCINLTSILRTIRCVLLLCCVHINVCIVNGAVCVAYSVFLSHDAALCGACVFCIYSKHAQTPTAGHVVLVTENKRLVGIKNDLEMFWV